MLEAKKSRMMSSDISREPQEEERNNRIKEHANREELAQSGESVSSLESWFG